MVTTKDLNLLFFIGNLGNGGAEMHLTRLSNALVRMGHRVTICVARSGGNYEQFLDERVTVVRGTTSVRSASLALSLMLFRLPAIIRRSNADVVMSILPWPNFAVISLKCLGLIRRPVVANIQNTPLFGRNRSLTGFLAKILYTRADAIICLSTGVQADIFSMLKKKSPPLTVINNVGYDERMLSEARAIQIELTGKHINIVTCGRLTEQKGHDVLLKAIHLLVQKVDVHLNLIGQGPLENSLKVLAGELGISERVTFWGFQQNPMAYMMAGDIFVLSSNWEGFGNVIVEAMACGKVVVSTDCKHGPSEIIHDGETGVLVPVGDASALADAIYRTLLQDPNLTRMMERRAIERSRDFSPARIAMNYVENLSWLGRKNIKQRDRESGYFSSR